MHQGNIRQLVKVADQFQNAACFFLIDFNKYSFNAYGRLCSSSLHGMSSLMYKRTPPSSLFLSTMLKPFWNVKFLELFRLTA